MPLPITGQCILWTCSGVTCCHAVGQTQAQHADDARIKDTVFGEHVGPPLVRGVLGDET